MTIPEAYTHAVNHGFVPENRTPFDPTDEAAALAYAAETVPDILSAGWNHLLGYLPTTAGTAKEICVDCVVENTGTGHRLSLRPTKLEATDRRVTEALTIARFDALRLLFANATGYWPYWLTNGIVHLSPTRAVDADTLFRRHDAHLRCGDGKPVERDTATTRQAVMDHLLANHPEGLTFLRHVLTGYHAGGEQYIVPAPETGLHTHVVAWLGSPTGRALAEELTEHAGWQLFCCCGPAPSSPMHEGQQLISWVNQLREQNPARILC